MDDGVVPSTELGNTGGGKDLDVSWEVPLPGHLGDRKFPEASHIEGAVRQEGEIQNNSAEGQRDKCWQCPWIRSLGT